MDSTLKKALAGAILGISASSAQAITIQFDYQFDSNNFFGSVGSIQRSILEQAGDFFASRIGDSLLAITPDANNQFNAVFNNPGTGASQTVFNLNVPTDTLIVYAGGRSLGGSTLGQGGPGGFSIPTAQSQQFINDAAGRGQAGAIGPSGSRTDFAPWGGAITFDNDASTTWYFDPDLSTDGDVVNSDFFSIALHELGHLLGFGTAASWDNLVSNGEFNGSISSGLFGGPVPVSGGHWADGTLGNNGTQETALDPIITNGTRKEFTDLDLAGLADLGWEVAPIPVPAAVWLFGTGLLGLFARGRKRV